MTKPFARNSETFKAIWGYLYGSLGLNATKISYAGTHSNEGLTPIIHYDIEAQLNFDTVKPFRATVYWNNATTPPTITRMDVM